MSSKETNTYIFIGKDDNVLAYCPECRVPVFNGSDKTQAGNRVLRDRVAVHSDWHSVDVIYPRKGKGVIIEGDTFLSMSQFPADKIGKKPV